MPIKEQGLTEHGQKPGCREIDLHGDELGGRKDVAKANKERTALDEMVKVNRGEGNPSFQGTLKLFEFLKIIEIQTPVESMTKV